MYISNINLPVNNEIKVNIDNAKKDCSAASHDGCHVSALVSKRTLTGTVISDRKRLQSFTAPQVYNGLSCLSFFFILSTVAFS